MYMKFYRSKLFPCWRKQNDQNCSVSESHQWFHSWLPTLIENQVFHPILLLDRKWPNTVLACCSTVFKTRESWTYLSKAIATRCKIEAVQHRTSLEVHMSQRSAPSRHSLDTSYTAPSGITRQATRRSATASDNIRWLATLWRFRSSRMAAITNTFPEMDAEKTQGGVSDVIDITTISVSCLI